MEKDRRQHRSLAPRVSLALGLFVLACPQVRGAELSWQNEELIIENQPVSYAGISLDPATREVRRGEMFIELTVTEFNLLQMFLLHPRQVLERRQILNTVWGYDFYGDDNVLEIYVGYLRKKLEADGSPRLIQTVRGIGYVLREAA